MSNRVLDHMQRRAANALLAVLACLAACSSKPKPPLPPVQPLAQLAVLPVTYEEERDTVTWRPAPAPARPIPFVVPVDGQGRPYPSGSLGPAIVGNLIGAALVTAIEHNKQLKRDAHADALRAVGIDPAFLVHQRLQDKLTARGIAIAPVGHNEAARVRQSNDYTGVTPPAGAVIDVRIGEYGFDHSNFAGGFAPMLGISAWVVAPGSDDQTEGYGYWADYRSRPKDPRWFTTPAEMTYPTLEAVKADAEAVRRGLEALIDRMVTRLADDIAKRASGQRAE